MMARSVGKTIFVRPTHLSSGEDDVGELVVVQYSVASDFL